MSPSIFFLQEVYDFITAPISVIPKSQMFVDMGVIGLYLRRMYVYNVPNVTENMENNRIYSIVVSNIRVETGNRRKGLASGVINWIHKIHDKDMTMIEIVQNEHLQSWLERNGWTAYTGLGVPEEIITGKNFYKLKTDGKDT